MKGVAINVNSRTCERAFTHTHTHTHTLTWRYTGGGHGRRWGGAASRAALRAVPDAGLRVCKREAGGNGARARVAVLLLVRTQ